LTRKPSVFYTEKRALTVFPYWLVVSVLVLVTVLTFLPYSVSIGILQSSFSKRMAKLVMQSRGISR
jgi:hypothetical protein